MPASGDMGALPEDVEAIAGGGMAEKTTTLQSLPEALAEFGSGE